MRDGKSIDERAHRSDDIAIGPTPKALAEWHALGLERPDLAQMRNYRLERIIKELKRHDVAGVFLFDPINICYATDATNMQVWTGREPVRAAFVGEDGYIILWDFARCEHLTAHL